MRKGFGAMGTLLVLGMGMSLLRGGPPSDQPSASTKRITTQPTVPEVLGPVVHHLGGCATADCAEGNLLDAIDSYFPGVGADNDSGKEADPVAQELLEFAKAGNQFSFTVAIVPDPIHTHLSLFFDRSIDAIEQGAQQEHWIFDRATMPWDSKEHPESTDIRLRLLQQDYQLAEEKSPGLMIFRPESQDPVSPNRSLFTFLVGETPTGGINKDQFRRAVHLIAAVSKGKPPLRIIGPTFSGSLYSLAQLLGNQTRHEQFGRVVIRSGTVSSWETMQWFKRWVQNQRSDDRLCVDFATFSQSDRYMLRKFIGFAHQRGYAADGIAVLAEDETAYGNFVAPSTAVATSKPQQQEATDAHSCPAEVPPDIKDDPGLMKDEDDLVHLYFPRDISQLRSAYQQGLNKQMSASSNNYEVHSILPLDLTDTGSDDDSVSQYAHSQTPLSQEAILLGIATALRQHKIDFVVLQATNPMDKLFLSRFLRKAYPQGRVVTMDGDLLMRRDVEDDALLHGVMSLGTYSLLPGADDHTAYPSALPKESHADHLFPAAASVAIFNATVSQLVVPKPNSDCPLPKHDQIEQLTIPLARYEEYGWPLLGGIPSGDVHLIEPLTPVTWLTVLGRDGYWPLAVLDDGKSVRAGNIMSALRPIQTDTDKDGGTELRSDRTGCELIHRACLPKFSRHSPLIWKLLYALSLALVVAYLQLLWRSSLRASSSLMTQLAPVKDIRRASLIAVIGCLLLMVLLVLLWPWVHWPAMSFEWVSYLIWLSLGVLFVGCIIELLRRHFPLIAGVFAVVAAAIIAAFLFNYGSTSDYTQDPFLYRYIHLTSGVSPLVPFLCLLAAGLWWAWFSLTGLTLVDKRHPRLPLAADLPDAIPQGHTTSLVTQGTRLSTEATRKLIKVMQPAGWDLRVYLPALFGTAITLFALDYEHPVLTLETVKFEWIYVVALGFAMIALLCALSRLFITWLECRKLLGTLDRFPLRRAFAQLNFAWEPIWRMGGARWQDLYRLVSRQLETLEHLKREITREHGDAVEALEQSISETALQSMTLLLPHWQRRNDKEPDLSDHMIDDYKALQKSIAHTCAKTLAYLQPKWWGNNGLILCEVGLAEETKSVTMNLADEKGHSHYSLPVRLAERFVALVYLNFILSVLLRMRTLAIIAGGLYIFILLSINSYPFEPRVALLSVAILMLLLVAGIVGYTFAEMHRNSILSLVTQTKPGELGMEFWVRMGVFVALPLLSLLASQLPALNNALFSWLEPALSALK